MIHLQKRCTKSYYTKIFGQQTCDHELLYKEVGGHGEEKKEEKSRKKEQRQEEGIKTSMKHSPLKEVHIPN